MGEAYDKVAKVLGLSYPGGPKIDDLSIKGEDTYNLPYPLDDDSYNFSFSGLKSAVLNTVNKEKQKHHEIRVADMCCSFQNRVVEILTKKTMRAISEYKVKNLIVAGGVSANNGLRHKFSILCKENKIRLSIPKTKYCTDNATMIGAAAYYAYKNNIIADLSLNAKAVDNLYNDEILQPK